MEFERRLYGVGEGPILLWHAAMILATSKSSKSQREPRVP